MRESSVNLSLRLILTPFLSSSVEYRADYGYFGLLAVHPSVKGKGLGSTLLSHAERSMLDEGLKQSGCQVVSPIPRLQTYYEQRGYYITGETEPWESDNLKQKAWFIMMRKDLVPSSSSDPRSVTKDPV